MRGLDFDKVFLDSLRSVKLSYTLCPMTLVLFFTLLVSATLGLVPGDQLCRSCGAFLFSQEDHIHGSVLSGPRIKSSSHSPTLGVNGTIHLLRKSLSSNAAVGGSESVVSVALYADGQDVTQERQVTPSLFPGFSQRRVVCSRCQRSVGWEFQGVEEGKEEGGKAPSAGVKGVTHPIPEPPPGVVPYLEEEGDLRLAFLKSAPCLLLPNGWWTQVLCHQKHVEQFHDKTRWSMGKYVQQHKVSWLSLMSALKSWNEECFLRSSPLFSSSSNPIHPPYFVLNVRRRSAWRPMCRGTTRLTFMQMGSTAMRQGKGEPQRCNTFAVGRGRAGSL